MQIVIEYSDEVKALENQREEIEKAIQAERENAKTQAMALIQQFSIKPEELSEKSPE
jgi:hypothetical protein